jgi:hypothetical protein
VEGIATCRRREKRLFLARYIGGPLAQRRSVNVERLAQDETNLSLRSLVPLHPLYSKNFGLLEFPVRGCYGSWRSQFTLGGPSDESRNHQEICVVCVSELTHGEVVGIDGHFVLFVTKHARAQHGDN